MRARGFEDADRHGSKEAAGLWPQVKQRCRPGTAALNASPTFQRLRGAACSSESPGTKAVRTQSWD